MTPVRMPLISWRLAFVCVCAGLFLSLAQAKASSETPVKDIYYSAIWHWDDYLVFADELENVLWNDSVLSKRQIWSMFLHTALASQNTSFEAVAQRELLKLGVKEEKIRQLYRLDLRELSAAQRAMYEYAQRAGVLPVKINANDLKNLRLHYDEREINNINVVLSYAATINTLYGTGYVADPELHPDKVITDTEPQLFSLSQIKQEHPGRFERRQFLESPILAPSLSMPYLGMDWVIFNDHRFSVRETWEWFTVGMRASDCKHCQAHGALGMHFEGSDRARIQQVYAFSEDSTFTAKETAAFQFIKQALTLPSQITPEHRQALEDNFSKEEIPYLLGVAGVVAQLSNFMQITAVVTDQESYEFAKQTLGPLGWHIGRHAGWPEEQRPMHPTTLHRMTWDGSMMDKNLMFYRHAFMPVMISYWGGKIKGPLFFVAFELLAAVILLRAYSRYSTLQAASD